MLAVVATDAGALELVELPDPDPGPGEVQIRVVASAVNRADTLQRRGLYPPPLGASQVLGLECSGTVTKIGDGVVGWVVGDRVCALLSGGGYASMVTVPAGQLMPIPTGVSLVEAASLPEVACTVWSNVFMTACLQPGETLLVHGGGGGIGTFAIQLASAMRANVATTASSVDKLRICAELGAYLTVNYREEDFVEVLQNSGGADVILDNMGAEYLGRNIEALSTDGRLVILGLQGGREASLDLATIMKKRVSIFSASLRTRSIADKASICAGVIENVWPLIAESLVRPVVYKSFPLGQVAEAHRVLEASEHIGKIVLTV